MVITERSQGGCPLRDALAPVSRIGHVTVLVDGGRRRRAEGVGERVEGERRIAEQADADLLEAADPGVVVVDPSATM